MLCDVPVSIDHLALPAADAEASARWFAEILGLAAPLPDGPDEEFATLCGAPTGQSDTGRPSDEHPGSQLEAGSTADVAAASCSGACPGQARPRPRFARDPASWPGPRTPAARLPIGRARRVRRANTRNFPGSAGPYARS